MPVQTALQALALRFAQDVVAVLRGELLGEKSPSAAPVERTPGPRKAGAPVPKPKAQKRASARKGAPIDYARVSAEIVAALKAKRKGLSSESIQKMIGREKREVFPTLGRLLASKAIRKTGQKRGTKYYAK